MISCSRLVSGNGRATAIKAGCEHLGTSEPTGGPGRPLCERALRIVEITSGPDHPHVATTLCGLAGVLRDLDEPVNARPLIERALHIHETSYGPDHPYVATTLYSLATVLRDLGEPTTARAPLQRALRIRESTYGPNHSMSLRIRQTLRQLADIGE